MITIVKKCISLKQQWLSKTPKGKWLFCYKIGDYALRSIGINVFNDNSHSIWTYSIAVAIHVHMTIIIYSIIVCYMEKNLENCLKSVFAGAMLTSVWIEILYKRSFAFIADIFNSNSLIFFTIYSQFMHIMRSFRNLDLSWINCLIIVDNISTKIASTKTYIIKFVLTAWTNHWNSLFSIFQRLRYHLRLHCLHLFMHTS